MFKISIAALTGVAMAIAAYGAQAQDNNMKPADGGMMAGKPAMSSSMNGKMSDADMQTMKMCQGMNHDAMMQNKTCTDMMKMHPDMMKSK